MAQTVTMGIEAQRTLAHGSFDTTYVAVGTALPDYTRALILYNGTDAVVQFSLDNGTTDFLPLPVGEVLYLDLFQLGIHTLASSHRVAVKDIGTPSSGSVYVGVVL